MSNCVEKFLNFVLETKDFDVVLKNGLGREQFVGFDEEFVFIQRFVEEYGVVPSVQLFTEKFDKWKFKQVDDTPEHLVKAVRENYLYCRLLPILQKTNDLAVVDSTEAATYLYSVIDSLPVQSMLVGEDISQTMNDRLSKIMEMKAERRFWPTGFPPLDKEFIGWRRGEELAVVVARTGIGKSWFLLKSASAAWQEGANVGFISPEMSPFKVGLRVDTLLTGFSNKRLNRGDVEVSELKELKRKAQEYQNRGNGFYVATPKDFGGQVTTSKVKMFAKSRQLDVLFIDGFTYVTSDRSYKNNSKTVCMTETAEDLMSISMELEVPIICAIQANREGDNGVPQLIHVRDSDGVAHNASKVVSLYRDGQAMVITVLKHRDGLNGSSFRMAWDVDTGVFNEIAADEAMSEDDFETV